MILIKRVYVLHESCDIPAAVITTTLPSAHGQEESGFRCLSSLGAQNANSKTWVRTTAATK